jgi:hypothetical protein
VQIYFGKTLDQQDQATRATRRKEILVRPYLAGSDSDLTRRRDFGKTLISRIRALM